MLEKDFFVLYCLPYTPCSGRCQACACVEQAEEGIAVVISKKKKSARFVLVKIEISFRGQAGNKG